MAQKLSTVDFLFVCERKRSKAMTKKRCDISNVTPNNLALIENDWIVGIVEEVLVDQSGCECRWFSW